MKNKMKMVSAPLPNSFHRLLTFHLLNQANASHQGILGNDNSVIKMQNGVLKIEKE